MRGVKVPPPRPAFPKTVSSSDTTGGVGGGGGGGGRERGGGGGGGGGGGVSVGDDCQREEEVWARLKQQEEEEEEEEEEKGEGEKPVSGEVKTTRKESKCVKPSPIITFKHTEKPSHGDTLSTKVRIILAVYHGLTCSVPYY